MPIRYHPSHGWKFFEYALLTVIALGVTVGALGYSTGLAAAMAAVIGLIILQIGYALKAFGIGRELAECHYFEEQARHDAEQLANQVRTLEMANDLLQLELKEKSARYSENDHELRTIRASYVKKLESAAAAIQTERQRSQRVVVQATRYKEQIKSARKMIAKLREELVNKSTGQFLEMAERSMNSDTRAAASTKIPIVVDSSTVEVNRDVSENAIRQLETKLQDALRENLRLQTLFDAALSIPTSPNDSFSTPAVETPLPRPKSKSDTDRVERPKSGKIIS